MAVDNAEEKLKSKHFSSRTSAAKALQEVLQPISNKYNIEIYSPIYEVNGDFLVGGMRTDYLSGSVTPKHGDVGFSADFHTHGGERYPGVSSFSGADYEQATDIAFGNRGFVSFVSSPTGSLRFFNAGAYYQALEDCRCFNPALKIDRDEYEGVVK